MPYELVQLDLCSPDYFNGCSSPYMVIMVFKDTTQKELAELIVEEYNASYEHLTFPNNGWPVLSSDDVLELAYDAMVHNTPFDKWDLPTAEEAPEDYNVYLHIGIEEV